jgi:dTDP-4-dehydrorhamnose reductase
VELARVVRDFVLPNHALRGVYHVASAPINKFDLLTIIARAYDKVIQILPSGELVIDRSLNADRFNSATTYQAPDWPELVRRMHEFQ